MVYLMRADRHTNTSIDRSFDLSSAFREIEYVIERAPRDYMLRPEMLTKQGMIMRRLDRLDKAMSLLEQARSLDPTYWRAYYEIANCQLARNRKDEARETLKQGLAASPNARVLRAMLDDLGGGGPTKATAPQSVSGAALRASGGEESDSPNAGAR
jgi:tetratricopeptide (TPR) repeat protein